jgi:hypothetical protein
VRALHALQLRALRSSTNGSEERARVAEQQAAQLDAVAAQLRLAAADCAVGEAAEKCAEDGNGLPRRPRLSDRRCGVRGG